MWTNSRGGVQRSRKNVKCFLIGQKAASKYSSRNDLRLRLSAPGRILHTEPTPLTASSLGRIYSILSLLLVLRRLRSPTSHVPVPSLESLACHTFPPTWPRPDPSPLRQPLPLYLSLLQPSFPFHVRVSSRRPCRPAMVVVLKSGPSRARRAGLCARRWRRRCREIGAICGRPPA